MYSLLIRSRIRWWFETHVHTHTLHPHVQIEKQQALLSLLSPLTLLLLVFLKESDSRMQLQA